MLRPQWLNEEENKLPIKSKTVTLTKCEGSLMHLVMPGQKEVSEQSSCITSSLVYSLDKESEDVGPGQIRIRQQREEMQETANTSKVGEP